MISTPILYRLGLDRDIAGVVALGSADSVVVQESLLKSLRLLSLIGHVLVNHI